MATESSTPRFVGTPFVLGDRTLIVPALSIGAMKDLLPRLQQLTVMGGIPSAEDINTIVCAALSAIQRNYPAITETDLLELIDIGNVKELLRVVLGRTQTELASAVVIATKDVAS